MCFLPSVSIYSVRLLDLYNHWKAAASKGLYFLKGLFAPSLGPVSWLCLCSLHMNFIRFLTLSVNQFASVDRVDFVGLNTPVTQEREVEILHYICLFFFLVCGLILLDFPVFFKQQMFALMSASVSWFVFTNSAQINTRLHLCLGCCLQHDWLHIHGIDLQLMWICLCLRKWK